MFLGFSATIGAHSISKEVAGFSPLWFPRGKLFVSLVSCVYCCACYSLRSDCLNDKNITEIEVYWWLMIMIGISA